MSDTPALSIRSLRFAWPGAERPVIEIDTLELAPGEQMLLTGGSGAGKSTLLQLLAGVIDPDEGAVLVNGREIHAIRGARRDLFRGESIGMIFQTFNLLHGFSAIENVMIAMMFSRIPRREHRERAEKLLRGLGIDRPGAPPEALSVGQQQRIAVARAVACQPALVLADEPTASLDPENAAVAMDLIQSACHDTGAALLCVSHDPLMAARFQRRASFTELAASR